MLATEVVSRAQQAGKAKGKVDIGRRGLDGVERRFDASMLTWQDGDGDGVRSANVLASQYIFIASVALRARAKRQSEGQGSTLTRLDGVG